MQHDGEVYPIILIWDVFRFRVGQTVNKSGEVWGSGKTIPKNSSLPARHKTVNLGSKRQRLGSGFVVSQKARASSPMIGEGNQACGFG